MYIMPKFLFLKKVIIIKLIIQSCLKFYNAQKVSFQNLFLTRKYFCMNKEEKFTRFIFRKQINISK